MDIRVLDFKTDYKDGKARDWVKFAPGDGVQTTQTWELIDVMRPPESFERDQAGDKMFHMKAVWSVIGPRYDAWKNDMEVPEDGIPLAAWSALNEAQVEEFRKVAIKTVEQLAGVTDSALEKVGLPDTRRLREQAKTFIDGKSASDMAAKLADNDEKLESAMAVIAELQAKLEAKEDKPKRGRPPKKEVDAA